MERLRVSWNGVQSDAFPVSRGVWQGGVISPILFALYIDDLLYELEQSGVGCYLDDLFVGALTYADDLTLLAPTLQKHLGYFNHFFRLSQLHRCDQGMLPNWFSWKFIEELLH